MQYKTLALATATLLITATSSAQADLFDRINQTMTDIENTVTRTESTIDRANGTAERLNEAAPAAGETAAPTAPAAAPATTSNTITAEEEEVLRRAREIEERKTLERAEAIRLRQRQASQ